ncbi:MAG TPA: protease inhibitor I42 family protein [Casimicrobiaceae bacterium]|nr:protease inhibitor I42 family protein [Casimicrobiaceae bacterium]
MNAATDTFVFAAKAGTGRRWLARATLITSLALLASCESPRGPYWPVIPPDLPPPRVVSGDADGTTIDVVRTQWLIVRLPVDAPSGYRWTFELGKDRVLYPSGDTPRNAEGTAAPATEFVFRAEGTGTTSVRFLYRNPDQPQSPPAKTLAFDVVAR